MERKSALHQVTQTIGDWDFKSPPPHTHTHTVWVEHFQREKERCERYNSNWGWCFVLEKGIRLGKG